MGELAFLRGRLLMLRLERLLHRIELRISIDRLVDELLHELRWSARPMHERGGLKHRVPIRRQANVRLRVIAGQWIGLSVLHPTV